MIFASLDVMSAAEEQQPIVVDFDKTSLVVLVLFVALTLVLKPLLFDPILKLFEEREKLIDGAKMQARHIDEKSAGALARYEAEMAKARAEGSAEREKIRAEGQRREQEILAAVREHTARAVEDGKKAAHAEADQARAALKAQAPALAMELAARVLGREVRS
jgi:F-type H+-transporting ATPase subunit b